MAALVHTKEVSPVEDPVTIFKSALGRMLADIDSQAQTWCLSFPTTHSVFRGEHLWVVSFELYGKGVWSNPHTRVSVRLSYCLGHWGGRILRTYWTCTGVEGAIKSLFDFLDKKDVCKECGCVKNKCDPCDPCEFFRAFRIARKAEAECVICLEKVYRTMLSCGHSFHITCLSGVDDSQGVVRCPMCRRELTKDEMEAFFENNADDDEDDMDEDDYETVDDLS